jgi:hypothetical protein
MKNNIKKISYTAGYLDGDGCFYTGQYFQKNRNVIVYEYSIQVVSVRIESLEFFQKNFGGYINQKQRRINHKQPYCWTLKNAACINLARAVEPFLRDKKIQCHFQIKLAQTIIPNCGKNIAPDIIQIRQDFMIQNKFDKHENAFVTKENIDQLKLIETIKPDDIDYPYLAGLIDSEGCFRIKKWKPKDKPNHVYAISLEIGNRRLPIFEFLMQRFGGSIIFHSKRPRKNACATWSISAFALSQLIPRILPYLIIKKQTAEKIIEFYETTLPNGGDRHSEKFKALYAQNLINREKIVQEIHTLNLKGLVIESSSL